MDETTMDENIEIALKGGEFKRLLEYQFNIIKSTYGLKKVDIDVLFFLSNCNSENTPTDIYKRLRLNRGHVSQAIDALMKKGYLVAMPDSEDRRSIHYTVSEQAKEVIAEIAFLRQNLEAHIFQGISEQEVALYKDITAKILKNIENLKNN